MSSLAENAASSYNVRTGGATVSCPVGIFIAAPPAQYPGQEVRRGADLHG